VGSAESVLALAIDVVNDVLDGMLKDSSIEQATGLRLRCKCHVRRDYAICERMILRQRRHLVLQVSERARDILKETLLNERKEENQVLRLQERENQFALGLGTADETDIRIEHDGMLILVAPADLAEDLQDVVIDCEERPEGARLVVLR
jgi:hypothetical protein